MANDTKQVKKLEFLDIVIGVSDKDWVGRKDSNKRQIVGKHFTLEAVEHGKKPSQKMVELLRQKGSKSFEKVENNFQGVLFLSAVEIKNNYQWAIIVRHKDFQHPIRLDLDAISFSEFAKTVNLSKGKLSGNLAYVNIQGDTKKRLIGIN